MPVRRPDRVLLQNVPLKFVRSRVTGHGRKGVDAPIALVPFIDFLIVLVVFLLLSFNATGQLFAQQESIVMPQAVNATELKVAPVVAIDAHVVTLEGIRVGDTGTLGQSAQVDRIEPLVEQLEAKKRNWSILHPADPFPATVILQSDVGVDFRVIKKVMFSAAQAGYANVWFAVNKRGGG